MPPELQREPEHRLPLGMTVIDSDAGYDRYIVVGHPDETCGEFPVSGTGKTVADFNEAYDEETSVIQVVAKEALDGNVDDWTRISLADLQSEATAAGLKVYSYPSERLKSTFSHVPNRVETHRDLICYQYARLTHLASTIDHPDQFKGWLLWTKYNELTSGEITMSSALKENQYQLKENLGYCTYCNRESETTFDHIIPRDAGGADDISNMVPACKSCNSSKSNKNIIDWHQEHGFPIDRVVVGKYLKLKWNECEEADLLNQEIPISLRNRWEGLEIARRIDQALTMHPDR
ncbi:HNH endonuclease [Natronosalvus amylolyticus]|uniref:HNH endonuclease n=1 Tax=Natronosalvus amylolyticus TaxID=2961994 RepID=UPI0020CA1EF0|nr:HNH endonuclease [Natronosalvus amylolyticus]